jgi:hypothetical protein
MTVFGRVTGYPYDRDGFVFGQDFFHIIFRQVFILSRTGKNQRSFFSYLKASCFHIPYKQLVNVNLPEGIDQWAKMNLQQLNGTEAV